MLEIYPRDSDLAGLQLGPDTGIFKKLPSVIYCSAKLGQFSSVPSGTQNYRIKIKHIILEKSVLLKDLSKKTFHYCFVPQEIITHVRHYTYKCKTDINT